MNTLIPLAVIAFSTTAALVTEFLQWFFVWRTPGFQALKANLAKHGKRVDEAKEGATSKNLKKKEARLQTWRTEASRQVAAYNWKAALGDWPPPPAANPVTAPPSPHPLLSAALQS